MTFHFMACSSVQTPAHAARPRDSSEMKMPSVTSKPAEWNCGTSAVRENRRQLIIQKTNLSVVVPHEVVGKPGCSSTPTGHGCKNEAVLEHQPAEVEWFEQETEVLC